MDMKKVTAAVKIAISLSRMAERECRLNIDLVRLRSTMTNEEYGEYMKRIAR